MLVSVPGVISYIREFEAGEIRVVEIALPQDFGVAGKRYPLKADMRPGNAFVAKPFGLRTQKRLWRLYTRSCKGVGRILQTIINDTHSEKKDTSPWWQTDQVKIGDPIEVRFNLKDGDSFLRIHEHKGAGENTVELESDWPGKKYVAIALSTGITPFLSHLRYMADFAFEATLHPNTNYVLLASVRKPIQLMFHDELMEMQDRFSGNFKYYPVLTREYPQDWSYGKGRIIKTERGTDKRIKSVDLTRLLEVVQDIRERHLRLCGGKELLEELKFGLAQHQVEYLSLKAEVW